MMIQGNFLSLTHVNDEDRDPVVCSHESIDVAEAHARDALHTLPGNAYIVIARVECTMRKETRIVKVPIVRSHQEIKTQEHAAYKAEYANQTTKI